VFDMGWPWCSCDKVSAINPAGDGWAIELEALICLAALAVFLYPLARV
jgi:hypothetical protein